MFSGTHIGEQCSEPLFADHPVVRHYGGSTSSVVKRNRNKNRFREPILIRFCPSDIEHAADWCV
jgi:hypothetical protein